MGLITTKMSSSETSDDRKRIKIAASKCQLKDVMKLLTKFSDDVKLLSKTLIESCRRGHLYVVKWIMENTKADVNYTGVIRVRYTWGEELDDYHTPLTAAFYYKHLGVTKYLVERSSVDVNLPDSK